MRAAGPGCGLAEQASPRAQLGWAESGRGLLRWPQAVKHSASFSFLFLFFSEAFKQSFCPVIKLYLIAPTCLLFRVQSQQVMLLRNSKFSAARALIFYAFILFCPTVIRIYVQS
jgi:hypothetical protein